MPKEGGNRTDLTSSNDSTRLQEEIIHNTELNKGVQMNGPEVVRDDTRVKLKDIGITRDQSSNWQRIASIPEESFIRKGQHVLYGKPLCLIRKGTIVTIYYIDRYPKGLGGVKKIVGKLTSQESGYFCILKPGDNNPVTIKKHDLVLLTHSVVKRKKRVPRRD